MKSDGPGATGTRAHHSSADRTVSERAGSFAHQNFLDRESFDESRQPMCHGGVMNRPRGGRKIVIPDLAETGVMPADHMKSGLRRAGGGERGEAKSGNGAENGKSTHDAISPVANINPVSAIGLRRSGAGWGGAPDMVECRAKAIGFKRGGGKAARVSAIAPHAVRNIIAAAPSPEVYDARQYQQDRRYCAGVTLFDAARRMQSLEG